MSEFWELVKESVITQALVTIIAVVTTCIMWIEGRPVPPELLTFMFTCVAFFFGSKMGIAQGTVRGSRIASSPAAGPVIAPPSDK